MRRTKTITLGVFLSLIVGGVLILSDAVPTQARTLDTEFSRLSPDGDFPDIEPLGGQGDDDRGGSSGDDDAPGETVSRRCGHIVMDSNARSLNWIAIQIAWTWFVLY